MYFRLGVLAGLLGNLLFAQAPQKLTASEIIRYGERQMRGESTQAALKMRIQKPDFTRTLTLRSWSSGDGKALVEILEPAKEEGISSLRVDNQMWNYLPKTDQVVRVPTSLMLQSWMGSDFTNDDLMKSSSLDRDYTHKLVRMEKIGSEVVNLIECTPKPEAPVVWGKISYWARVSDNLPVRESYYDPTGKWVRTMNFSRFKKMDDRVVPTKVVVTVAENPKQNTTIVYGKLLYDRSINEAIFNQDTLRKTSENGKTLAAEWSKEYLPSRKQKQVAMRAKTPSRGLARRGRK